MSDYTSHDATAHLIAAGFAEPPDTRVVDVDVLPWRSDTLLAWLLSHGDSIEITPDLDGFNCTFWKDHHDYNGISIFLPDALAELVLKVMEVSK